MALKQLILSDKLRKAQEKLALAQQKAEEQRSARAALETREQELIQAREEVNEETTPEEQQILEEQIEAWEEQEAALTQTENEIAAEIETVQQEIADLEQQLEEVNARGMAKPKAPEQKPEERKERTNMSKYETRRLWFGMDHQERDAFIARDDIKAFAQHVRSMIGNEQRTFTGAELTIPTVILPLIRLRVEENSKLMKHVNVQRVGGESKVTILGTIPEAVWTAMCGKINELQFAAGAVTLDGHKVAGYVPLCNAVKEDSDLDLVTLVLELLGKAIGLALDKAILYGAGGRMPMGIVTRLARKTAPENYPATAPAWEDLSATNVLAISGKTGTALFQELIKATGAINSDYTNGSMFWAMSHKTRTQLVAQAVTFNASGAVVAGIENTMPVIGGAIETLNFIPDDVIIGGYGDMYLLAERAGMELGYSEHAHYIEDETIFRGKARYDGMPVIPGAFVAIGISGTAPTADAVTFAADKANQNV